MKAEIDARFRANLDRVENFVTTYDNLIVDRVSLGLRASTQGRASVHDADFLRGAVVFLHATLEDLLRSLLAWKWPVASPELFEEILVKLPNGNRFGKVDLRMLAAFRGSSVDSIVQASVNAWLEVSNFGDPGEIETALKRIGIATATLDPFRDYLGPMMKRRHWIVHRADRNLVSGTGHHLAQSIDAPTVHKWCDEVERFGEAVLAQL